MCFSEQFLADVIFTGVQMKLFWGRRKRNLAKWGRGGGAEVDRERGGEGGTSSCILTEFCRFELPRPGLTPDNQEVI